MAFKEYFTKKTATSGTNIDMGNDDANKAECNMGSDAVIGQVITVPLSDVRMPKSSIIWNTTRGNQTKQPKKQERDAPTALMRISSLGFGRLHRNVVTEERFESFEPIVQVILLLIRKYTLDDSEFAINIPYALRSRYTRLYRDPEGTLCSMSFEDRITVFDACFLELFKLLRDSFSRFVKRKEYEKCVQLIVDV